jgi:hypothetical protein
VVIGLLAGAVMLIAASLVVAACLRLTGRVAFLLAAGIAGYAEVVLIAFGPSALGALGQAGWLLGELVVLVAGLGVWQWLGRPWPAGWDRVPARTVPSR